MVLSRLQELKRQVVNDKDLMKVWEFFLDNFGEDLEFLDLGQPIRHEELETTIAHISLEMFPNDGTMVMIRLIHLPEQKFIHGSVNVAGRDGGVIYFEDIRVGVVTASDGFPSKETKFARFSTQPYKPERKPSWN
jgi:hypothetical protein